MNIASKRMYFLLAGLSFVMPFLTGFLGLLPIDQSIIFEAGGRISKGEWPFTDFYLPYGLVPAFIQSGFFKLLGVSWFSYVFHAAVFNAIFALILFDVLRIWLPSQKHSKLVGITLLASWSFYPMMGTPFMDTHSFFFGLLSYWSVLAGMVRKKPLLLLLCFTFLLLGFYSKPLPVIFWVFPIILECWLNREHFRFYIRWLIPGCLLALFFIALPFFIFNAEQFYYYTYRLPFRIGQERMNMSSGDNFFLALFTREKYKIWVGILVILVSYFLFKVKRQENQLLLAFYRCSCILLVSVTGAALTRNTFYHLLVTAIIIAFGVYSCFNFKFTKSSFLSRTFETLFRLGWIFFVLIISWVNFSRRVNEIVFYVNDLNEFSPALGIFPKTIGNDYSPQDLQELYVLMKKENCLYIGDMFFVYSLTGSTNPWPVSHLHDGTSYNSKDVVQYDNIKTKLVNNLDKNRTTVVIEDILFYGPEPLVQFANGLRGRMKQRIGKMIVYEMDTAKLAWMVSNLKIKRAK